jgi:hypothetical protein
MTAIGGREDEKEAAVGEPAFHQVFSANSPVGRTSRMSDQHDEGRRGAVFGAHHMHGRAFGHADDQPAQHRAPHRADAAQDDGGKQRQQQVQPQRRPQLHRQPREDAGHRRQHGADDPGGAQHALGVDAGHARQLRVHRGGAHRAPERAARQEQVHAVTVASGQRQHEASGRA